MKLLKSTTKFILVLILPFGIINAQTKREQIALLNYKIDSLNTVISDDRAAFNKERNERDNQLQGLKNEIDKLKTSLEMMGLIMIEKQSRIDSISALLNEKMHVESELKKAQIKIKTLLNDNFNQTTKIEELENQLIEINSTFTISNSIIFKLNQKINNYQLEIIFYPKEIENEYYQGTCTVNFIKDEELWSFSYSDFNLSKSLFTDLDLEFSNENEFAISSARLQVKNIDLEKLPLSYLDINFDKSPEFILTNLEGGQRGVSSYNAFSFNEYGIIDANHSWFHNELLDEMTEIIEEERKIIFQHSNGADSSYSTIYKAEFGEYGFEGFKFIQQIPH